MQCFLKNALEEERKIIYMRFGQHEEIVQADPRIKRYELDASTGFETFSSQIYSIATAEGEGAFYSNPKTWNLTFKRLFEKTDFANTMQDMMNTIEKAYQYPIDMEFTANFLSPEKLQINLLQCRPLATLCHPSAATLVHPWTSQTNKALASRNEDIIIDKEKIFLYTNGNFMGSSFIEKLHKAIYVKVDEYLSLNKSDKYQVARIIGKINCLIKNKELSATMLIGPGRWGSSTPHWEFQ